MRAARVAMAAVIAVGIAGCAATYKPPETTYQALSAAAAGSKTDLMRKARQALVADAGRPRERHADPHSVNAVTAGLGMCDPPSRRFCSSFHGAAEVLPRCMKHG